MSAVHGVRRGRGGGADPYPGRLQDDRPQQGGRGLRSPQLGIQGALFFRSRMIPYYEYYSFCTGVLALGAMPIWTTNESDVKRFGCVLFLSCAYSLTYFYLVNFWKNALYSILDKLHLFAFERSDLREL